MDHRSSSPSSSTRTRTPSIPAMTLIDLILDHDAELVKREQELLRAVSGRTQQAR